MSETPEVGRAATPGPDDVAIGNRIKLRRNLLGLSQHALADQLGLTFQQIQKYERGSNRVSASRLGEIARVLDVPIGFFYEDVAGHAAFVARQPIGGFAETQARFGAPPASVARGLDPEDQALVGRKDAIELLRAFYGIPDAAVRRKMLDLVRSMGG